MPGRLVQLRLLGFDNEKIPVESFVLDPSAPPSIPGVAAPVKGFLNHQGVAVRTMGGDLIFSKSSRVEDIAKPEHFLAKVKLPSKGDRFMLIFLPAAGQTFQILALDDSVREFPLGSYRVVNLSRLPVRLTLEKKSYAFKPGQIGLIEDPPVQANQHSAMYAFAAEAGKEQRIGSGLWPHPGNKRSVQLFFDNPESGQTELRGFRDISPPLARPVSDSPPAP